MTLRGAGPKSPGSYVEKVSLLAGMAKARLALNATTGVFIREGQRDRGVNTPRQEVT